MKTRVTGTNLHKLVERCQDLEKRGFECIIPIKKIEQVYHRVEKAKDFRKSGSISMGVSQRYVAVYEKVMSHA